MLRLGGPAVAALADKLVAFGGAVAPSASVVAVEGPPGAPRSPGLLCDAYLGAAECEGDIDLLFGLMKTAFWSYNSSAHCQACPTLHTLHERWEHHSVRSAVAFVRGMEARSRGGAAETPDGF